MKMTDEDSDKKRSSGKAEVNASRPPATGDRPELPAREIGGRKGPEPTRYGDWEKNGIASDF
ncbi:MAG: hypothetical protein Kow00104_10760 [Rhodothalassiaceae bacterium]